MRRLLCLMIVIGLTLSGCGIFADDGREPVTFYYLRAEYQYGAADSVIGTETRDVGSRRESLSYLLSLYLMGPADEELQSPFPNGVQILSAEQTDSGVSLQLSETSEILTDAEFSLACACLTLTCANLTDSDQVTVNSGSRSVTMSPSTLTLSDSVTPSATEETQ